VRPRPARLRRTYAASQLTTSVLTHASTGRALRTTNFPSAVEAVIAGIGAVAEVVVIGVPDDTWGEVVTAVVVPREGAALDPAEIERVCGERLAGYMRPRTVEIVPELPKNPSGKLLRGEVRRRYSDVVGRV
jgi:acyl-CoA synthetase (AMP-forming)/AMP-acid ligase II